MKCPNCRASKQSLSFLLTKCQECGAIKKGFGHIPKKGFKLQIRYDENSREIEIIGNRSGLEYLAKCCLAVIGKLDPSGHINLDPIMYNLSFGSNAAILKYVEDKHNRIPYAATGKRWTRPDIQKHAQDKYGRWYFKE